MSQTPQINLLNSLLEKLAVNPDTSAKDITGAPFKDLLKKNINLAPNGEWGRGLFIGQGADRKAGRQKAECKTNPVHDLTQVLANLGVATDALRLPAHLTGKLVQFFKEQGWEQSRIDALLTSAKDRDGNILLNKLLQKLQKVSDPSAQGGDRLLIDSKDIPRVQEVLYQGGVQAGPLKDLLEKATTQKGELSLERLSRALGDLSGNPISAEDLREIFKQNQINVKPQIQKLEDQIRQLTGILENGTGPEDPRAVKNALAQALIAKGIPPREVKTLLEKSTFEQSRLKGAEGQGAGLLQDPKELQKQLSDLLKGATFDMTKERSAEGWRQAVAETVQTASLGKAKGSGTAGKTTGILNFSQSERENVALQAAKDKNNPSESLLSAKSDALLKIKGEGGEELIKGLKKTNSPSESLGEWNAGNGPGLKRIQGASLDTTPAIQDRSAYDLPQPLPKVLERLIWMVQAGEQKSRLSMVPPELGRLDVEIVMKQGHLQAKLSAENPAVKELIEANLGNLRQQLTDQGVIVDQIRVAVGLHPHSGERERMATEEQSQQRSRKHKEAAPEAGPVGPTVSGAAAHKSLYQIDLHV